MIKANFSEIKEQTPKDGRYNSYATFDGSCLTVTTQGGQEFLVNTRWPIVQLHPISDGLLIACKPEAAPNLNYLTLSSHPLNDIHPLASEAQHLTGMSDMVLWSSNLIPFLVTYSFGVVEFNLIVRQHQEDELPLGQRGYGTSQQSTHKLRVVETIKIAQRPTKVEVTQGLKENELIVSLFSAKDQKVHVFKSDLQLRFTKEELPFSVSGIVPFDFLTHSNEVPLFTEPFSSEDDEVRYFKHCIKALPRDTCIMEADKLTVLLGGQYAVHSIQLQNVSTGQQLVADKHLVKVIKGPKNQEQVYNPRLEITDRQISAITDLLKRALPEKDYASYVKRFVPCAQTTFVQYGQQLVALICGPAQKKQVSPTKQKISSPIKKPTSAMSSPIKKSQITTSLSPVKKSSIIGPSVKPTVKPPFERMLELHRQRTELTLEPRPLTLEQTELLVDLYQSFHLLYLDLQLTRGTNLRSFKQMMAALATQLGLQEYRAFYSDCPSQALSFESWIDTQEMQFPLLYEQSRKIVRFFEVINQTKRSFMKNPQKPQLLHLYQSLMVPNDHEPQYRPQHNDHNFGKHLHSNEKLLYALYDERFGTEQIDRLPYNLQAPLQEIIGYTRLHIEEVKTTQWPIGIYKLIQREDILNNIKSTGQPATALQILQNPSLHHAFRSQKSTQFDSKNQDVSQNDKFVNELLGITSATHEDNKDLEAQQLMEQASYVRATHNDTRHQEAERMLLSDIKMKIKAASDVNEEERIQKSKIQLEKMFRRQLAKCVGRGAFTLGTAESLPTQKLKIPEICNEGFLDVSAIPQQIDEESQAQQQKTLKFELTSKEAKDMLQWAEFHNGVSAALQISQQGQVKNARNWIMFHRPQNPKNKHGGFLLGLGLLGQLDCLMPTDVYQHLKSAHDSTTIGILLGRAASKVGKMDEQDSKLMCLHIPALLPHTVSLDYSLPVQSAAVIGAGLLYQASSYRQITELLLSQICRKPTSDKPTEREGYALASGIAIGMVNLGVGKQLKTSAQSLLIKELELDQRLIRFVEGGKMMPLPKSMLSQIQLGETFKSSAIKENDMVNTTITAPGALVALALMYLKSHNRQVVEKIKVPETFEALDCVTPTVLTLKVLAKNLILWDHIDCTHAWVQNQIPQIIRTIYECKAEADLSKHLSRQINENDVDFFQLALCVANIKAAAILSIGFKYAGTSDPKAKNLIIQTLNYFREEIRVVPSVQPLGQQPAIGGFGARNCLDKNTADSSLCICVLALSMVMAGSCDLESFRVIRVLRKRFETDMHFGYNQAVLQALGLLFLGNGRYTLSRTDKAIAGLLCSVYPIFPSTPQDNRYHLQALRHFYVFALETRLLQAKDIDSGEYVNLEVEVQTIVGSEPIQSQKLTTPDIVNGQIQSIQIRDDPTYHDLHLNLTPQSDQMQVDHQAAGEFKRTDMQKIIFVKRKQIAQNSSKPEKLSLRKALQYGLKPEELRQYEADALHSLSKVKDQSVRQFLETFAIRNDPTEILTDLLMQEGHDYFQVAGMVEKILNNSSPPTNLTLLQLHECYTDGTLDKLPLLLSQLQRHASQAESSSVQGSEEILRELETIFGEQLVQQYRVATSLQNSADFMDERLAEIHHAVELLSVNQV